MRLDSPLLVEDRADRQVALEIPKCLLDLDQLQIVAPHDRRIGLCQVAPQEIPAFPPVHLAQLVLVQAIAERRLRRIHLDRHQSPGTGRLLAGRTQLHQLVLAPQLLHGRQLIQAASELLELPTTHRAFLGDPIRTAGQDVQFPFLRQQLDLSALQCTEPVSSLVGSLHRRIMQKSHMR